MSKLGTANTVKVMSPKGSLYNVRPASVKSTKVKLPQPSGKQGRG